MCQQHAEFASTGGADLSEAPPEERTPTRQAWRFAPLAAPSPESPSALSRLQGMIGLLALPQQLAVGQVDGVDASRSVREVAEFSRRVGNTATGQGDRRDKLAFIGMNSRETC